MKSKLALMQVCLTLPLCSGTSFLLSLPLYCLTNVHAALYSEQKAADAHAYKVRIEAEARFLAAAKDAEALLVRQQKEAAGPPWLEPIQISRALSVAQLVLFNTS